MTDTPENNVKAEAEEDATHNKNARPRSKVYGWRLALITGEVLAVLLLVVVLAASVLVWRLKSGPVDISFARDYVQSALHDEATGMYGTMDSAYLHWPDLQGPLFLGLQGGRVYGPHSREILFVDEIALSLSKTKLLIGMIEPLSLIIKRPSLRIIRSEDDTFDFGLGTQDTIITEQVEAQAEEQKSLIENILDVIEQPESDAVQNSTFGSLRTLEIEDASVIVEDHKLGASWFFPGFDIAFGKADQGVLATIDFDLPDVVDKKSHIHARILLDRDNQVFEAQTVVENLDLQIFASKIEALDRLRGQNLVMSGDVRAVFGPNFGLRSLQGKVYSEEGDILDTQLSDLPVPYRDFYVDVAYAKKPEQALRIENLRLTLGEITVRGGADIAAVKSEDGASVQGYRGPVQITIDDTPHSALAPVWPAALREENATTWIIERMSGGTLSGLRADGVFVAQKKQQDPVQGESAQSETTQDISSAEADGWDVDIQQLVAHFAVDGVDVDYRNPLPPVKSGTAKGVFDLDADTLSIAIEKADLGGLAVTKADLNFTDIVAEGKGAVAMEIALNGPLKNVFEYISTEPIDLKEALDMDLEKVKGSADLNVKLQFPTHADLQVEEIKMDITGKVNDGFLPSIVRDLPLSGGPFDVSVNNERYTVKGSGLLSVHPVTLEWMEYLDSKGKPFKHQSKATINVDKELRDHFGIDIDDFVEGVLPAEIVYTGYSDGKAEAQASVDTTRARVFNQTFEYEKPVGTAGKASLKANLQKNELVSITGLNVSAPGLDISDASMTFRGSGANTEIAKVNIPRGIIGETHARATVTFEPNGIRKIVMIGEKLDARPFMNDNEDEKNKPYTDPPTVLSVTATQMRTSDDDVVNNVKLFANIDDQGRYNQLEMDALAGGKTVYLRFKPNEQGVRTFRLEADDAGAFLKAFDVYPNIRGGKLVIYGEPIRGVFDRNLIGLAEITNFRVVQAPALARLLGVLSLSGVSQLLNNNEGLTFTKLEAKFDWLYRRGGSMLVLKEGRTSGNSLGLTFDGTFDNAADRIDVSGTIIPLSGVNKVIGSIPLVGDILTGGTGSLFAATYSMKGQAENPEVNVNPLSVLTPGILRRILFE